MNKPFREYHLLKLLQEYEEQQPLPLDLYVSNYFRTNKSLGSKDKAQITQLAYGIIRWKGLLDFLSISSPTWEERLDLFKKFKIQNYLFCDEIPLHIRLSCPKFLFDLMVENFGLEKTRQLCLINNQQAPITVRVNPLKTTRDDMLVKWGKEYDISPCKLAPHGIIFHKKIAFFALPEFKKGLFEVQDEGSQLAAELMRVKEGQQALDYCAGSGGKTLAFAPQMKHSGQIYLHDIRSGILQECRRRLRRAGIQNAQIVMSDQPKLKNLKKRMDWILVDVPCSGTGTLRRNVDSKWKFDPDMLNLLLGQQRLIFEKALSYLRPGGRIVYVTCSILSSENEAQVNHFMKTYNLEMEDVPFQSFPSEEGMDGFYGVTLKSKISI
jgi:16S rRNA (cytosine967-C5)-methyltransferase